MIGFVVMDFMQRVSRPHPFKQAPGYKWWNGFLKRWPQLSERKAQHLSQKRAQGANSKTIEEFFAKLEDLFCKIGIRCAHDLADRLLNCDETGLCNASGSTKVLAKRGSQNSWWFRAELHHNTWVWFCLWSPITTICCIQGEEFVWFLDSWRACWSHVCH